MDLNCIGQAYPEPCKPYSQSLLQQLSERKANAERSLSEINAAIDALNSNPEVAKLLDLISKVR